MKLLLIAPLPPPTGGVATVTENIVEYLKTNNDGINISICNTSHKLRPITNQSLIIRFYTGITHSIQLFFKIRRLLKHDKPQVIHLASSASFALLKDIVILYIAKWYKVPVVIHLHFGRIPSLALKQNWEWNLLCKVMRKSTWSVVIDQYSFNTLKASGFSKISYIPNPISLFIEQKANDQLWKKNKRYEGRLLFVGHVIKAKGIYELVKSCLKIPEIKELIIIGPYERYMKNELMDIAEERDNGDWLKLIGTLELNEVLEYMSETPILALPSYTEGFPNVVIEAMAMGCAIIASDVGAIPEMVGVSTNKPCGICIPAQDAEKLKEAISNLINDPGKVEMMGKWGRERVLQNYTLSFVIGEYKNIWNNAVYN